MDPSGSPRAGQSLHLQATEQCKVQCKHMFCVRRLDSDLASLCYERCGLNDVREFLLGLGPAWLSIELSQGLSAALSRHRVLATGLLTTSDAKELLRLSENATSSLLCVTKTFRGYS
mmetsp:Transcript_20507/g.65450  ORF Transcript_20507/g.65450 Transcript_20507/m.65450 type:complete len:117 (-) Transcript_20507:61-411(-)